MVYFSFFFFSSRRRHTRCLSDWSSDVCSSDLPHGVVLGDHIATGVLDARLRHPDRRVQIGDPDALGEIDRMERSNGATGDFPLSLIGLRELRSHNSWMHNSPLLMRGGRTHALRIHPGDAASAGLAD